MMTEYCAWPPQLAADLESAAQPDGERPAHIVGAASVGRYILLRATEMKVLQLLGEAHTTQEVCTNFQAQHGGKLALATLVKFLTKLDEAGILAGERTQATDQAGTPQHYLRFNLFNPDQFFARMIPGLRWIWTTGFVAVTVGLMLVAAWRVALNWAEFSTRTAQLVSEHYLLIFLAGTLVVFSHEFAHGLTCKAFGGRATEVGFLLVYYFLPALYCNVSGIHLIPQRNRRLWVIAAGIYWQLIVGTLGLLAWCALAPETLLADVALAFGIGSLADVVLNTNPLIKLDGYYFLSQWLRLPNLMDRSRAYWCGVWERILTGVRDEKQYSRRERKIYAAFGLLSVIYTVLLIGFIIAYVGEWLMDTFYLLGLLLTLCVALLFVRKPLKSLLTRMVAAVPVNEKVKTLLPRRRLIPLALALLLVAVLVAPWRASVGSYGTLVALPGQETIIRAPEAATLVELRVRPGEQVTPGAVIARLGNLDVEEQIVQVQTDLARVQADYDRVLGELRVRGEAAARADLALRQRQHEFDEIDAEQRRIRARTTTTEANAPRVIPISTAAFAHNEQPATYPAALAALQAEVDAQRAQLNEAATQSDRLRRLHAQGIIARSELDAAETRAATLSSALDAARQRLNAALIEHRRRHTSTATEMRLAETDAGTERLTAEKLSGELRGLRDLMTTLASRRDLLERKRAQFELTTPRAGAVFGEELPRLAGQYFQKGAEICRIADTRQLLVRIQVPEREIGDVQTGHPVRLKAKAFPNRTFYGTVTKIGGESETDAHGQTTYRVELTIENAEGFLRPGMTAFARIDFGREMIGQILWRKLKQSLRPELWML
jgi:putative peptide zinc metalloprotease protein